MAERHCRRPERGLFSVRGTGRAFRLREGIGCDFGPTAGAVPKAGGAPGSGRGGRCLGESGGCGSGSEQGERALGKEFSTRVLDMDLCRRL